MDPNQQQNPQQVPPAPVADVPVGTPVETPVVTPEPTPVETPTPVVEEPKVEEGTETPGGQTPPPAPVV